MAKKIAAVVKVNLPAGEATPAPPVGPVLGQHGIPIMDFIKQYNARTANKKGQIIPAVIIDKKSIVHFEFQNTKINPSVINSPDLLR